MGSESLRMIPALRTLALLLTSLLVLQGQALAQSADHVDDLPVLSAEVPRGGTSAVPEPASAPVPRTIDGRIDDWVGSGTGFGGTTIHSTGELVYQDHLFDAHGADDGRDAERLETTEPLTDAIPETYRVDALAQADAPGELGIPAPEEIRYDDTYGDATQHQDDSDIYQVRVGASGDVVDLLVRTTTMTAERQPGILVLVDNAAGTEERAVPFNSGITSSTAEVAIFLGPGSGTIVDLVSGAASPLPEGTVASDPSGYVNAREARLPASLFSGSPSLAVATGPLGADGTGFAELELDRGDGDQPNLANVAFRTDEPVRVWFERDQALALHAGTVDPFFHALDIERLRSGASETFEPGPGYHDRIFTSSEYVSVERSREGLFQHYGVYLPTSYEQGTDTPLQWWLHWRGGNAHTAAGVAPRIFKHFGEDRDTIVVSPSGRGTGRWYVGKGHVDFLEVWTDVLETFTIDRNRVYVTGHSMGGWGSYLLTLLYPDRFAAAAPVAGPVTQGAWTGADFPGCDSMTFDEYSPCYISANGSRPRDQHTRKLLENARHVPYAILHGTSDELVPYSGVARQAERLLELGYRHRLYTYPGYEHYSHPVMDQWTEPAAYMDRFVRDPNPAQITYKRDMLFERATEEVQSDGVPLAFDFDSAYWMSDLTPVDHEAGVASIDAVSHALHGVPYLAAPDAGGPSSPGTTGPFVATGIQWLADPTAAAPEPSNSFDAELTGAERVRLDVARMGLDDGSPITSTVTTSDALALSLAGGWRSLPDVTVDGEPAATTLSDGILTISLAAGTHQIVIEPTADEPAKTDSAMSLEVTGKGAQRTLEALLWDITGQPLEGRTVTFFADGRLLATAVTDAGGRATVTLDRSLRGGHHVFVVVFDGDGSYNGSSAETST
ncbi:MAG TPA: prolyl oligopeptidase family serine peptidase [Actinomycetota bacterium]|nr:prolyl oligopeptidase family serine peptidase [Actinomycetota bacterium]